MAKISINGRQIECRDKIPVLQAALEAGFDVPHYCYHPALSIVASCRLCLMEMKTPDPKTRELEWSGKLVPSCQTPVREGMEVRFDTPAVRSNVEHVMEYYLINHPLDCPVCDQAGECWLQDYSYESGYGTSRAVDPKVKNPKKDIGSKTLLYQDRCVMCSRCVRFTNEISGTYELTIVNRANRAEIDIFPGQPLENKLQGNVVDICPVGALLDKEFLMKQRVWFLKSTNSICRQCSTGCAIHVDANRNRVWRLRPRFNPGVNDWWICDDGRYSWKHTLDERRIVSPLLRRGTHVETPSWDALPRIIRLRFEDIVVRHGPAAVAAQLSPEMSCEEAWLLALFIRQTAPGATLFLGDVQTAGPDERFPVGAPEGQEKFVIRAEKHPNRRGVQTLIEALAAGGHGARPPQEGVRRFLRIERREDVYDRCLSGEIRAMWVVGGYPRAGWAGKELLKAVEPLELLVVQDVFPSPLSEQAEILLPFCAWTEREGTFMNHAGDLQPFDRATEPPEGAVSDGQFLYTLAGYTGLYNGPHVHRLMAEATPALAKLRVPPMKPRHQH